MEHRTQLEMLEGQALELTVLVLLRNIESSNTDGVSQNWEYLFGGPHSEV